MSCGTGVSVLIPDLPALPRTTSCEPGFRLAGYLVETLFTEYRVGHAVMPVSELFFSSLVSSFCCPRCIASLWWNQCRSPPRRRERSRSRSRDRGGGGGGGGGGYGDEPASTETPW